MCVLTAEDPEPDARPAGMTYVRVRVYLATPAPLVTTQEAYNESAHATGGKTHRRSGPAGGGGRRFVSMSGFAGRWLESAAVSMARERAPELGRSAPSNPEVQTFFILRNIF